MVPYKGYEPIALTRNGWKGVHYNVYLSSVGGPDIVPAFRVTDRLFTGFTASGSSSWSNNTWYHVIGVYDGVAGTVKLYINGVESGSVSGAGSMLTTPSSGQFTIGATEDNGGTIITEFFPGAIDEVRVYNRALSQSDVQELYNFSGGTPPLVVTFSAAPSSLIAGNASTLTWSSTNATSCYASGGWRGIKATSGSQSVSPAVTTTYTVTCIGAEGSVNDSATVTVAPKGDAQAPSIPPNPSATAVSSAQQTTSSGVAVTVNRVQSLLPAESGNHTALAQVVAFPGAQGFGAKATGGRGGSVVKVTNLNRRGTGSLQWAVNQRGARIVVFDVSGVINGDIHIPHGDLTIAGQTAPGAGITLVGHLYADYGDTFGNIIIRHIRIRPPGIRGPWSATRHDTIQLSTLHTIILDHVDASYGADEIMDFWGGAQDVTIQWSAITFPDPANRHNYGLIFGPGGGRVSVHHNLFAHSRTRNPASSDGPSETINNVVYNYREGFVHHNPVQGNFNIIGNYYKSGGEGHEASPLWFDPENTPKTGYFVSQNYVDDPGEFVGIVNNPFTTPGFNTYSFYCCGISSSHFNYSSPFDFFSYPQHVPVTVDDPHAAYDTVLDTAGAWPRDIVTKWAVDDVRNKTGTWQARRPSDFLDGLTPTSVPLDSDHDGMSDAWENSHGLNPSDGSDHVTVMPSGYTAIEQYINELADALLGSILP
jgi:pectate lyase